MIICGGQPVSAAIVRRAHDAFPGTDFFHVYGLAEAGGTVAFIRPPEGRARPGSVGKAASHVELRVVDDDGDEVAPGSRARSRCGPRRSRSATGSTSS